MISKNLKEKIIYSLLKYSPKKISVFGSYARNEQNSSSDLDLLIDFNNKMSLFEIIEIEDKLSDELGVKVDLLTSASLSKYLKPSILNDLQVIYG